MYRSGFRRMKAAFTDGRSADCVSLAHAADPVFAHDD
jgi:hypothetical protein